MEPIIDIVERTYWLLWCGLGFTGAVFVYVITTSDRKKKGA